MNNIFLLVHMKSKFYKIILVMLGHNILIKHQKVCNIKCKLFNILLEKIYESLPLIDGIND